MREGFCHFLYFFPSEGRVKEGFAIFCIFFLLREGCVKGGFFRWEGKGEKEPLNFSFFEVQREGEGRMNEMPTYGQYSRKDGESIRCVDYSQARDTERVFHSTGKPECIIGVLWDYHNVQFVTFINFHIRRYSHLGYTDLQIHTNGTHKISSSLFCIRQLR